MSLKLKGCQVNCPYLYFVYLKFYNSFYFWLTVSLFILFTVIDSIHDFISFLIILVIEFFISVK